MNAMTDISHPETNPSRFNLRGEGALSPKHYCTAQVVFGIGCAVARHVSESVLAVGSCAIHRKKTVLSLSNIRVASGGLYGARIVSVKFGCRVVSLGGVLLLHTRACCADAYVHGGKLAPIRPLFAQVFLEVFDAPLSIGLVQVRRPSFITYIDHPNQISLPSYIYMFSVLFNMG